MFLASISKIRFALALPLMVLVAIGCGSKHYSKLIIEPVNQVEPVNDVQTEVDEIFSLLTYAIVYKDWQSQDVPREKRRGYNIGALLVNDKNEPVFHGLNCINSTDNATQHGEVRSIIAYLDKTKKFNLTGHTIYTSLEPCVMCAGMITMTAFKRAVYVQHDVEYSKAFERLAIDTRPIGGFPPYPRQVAASANNTVFCKKLDRAYHDFLEKDPEKILAKFLTSEEARSIFQHAYDVFLNFKVKHPENSKIYDSAKSYFERI